jgi:hypothetical protein
LKLFNNQRSAANISKLQFCKAETEEGNTTASMDQDDSTCHDEEEPGGSTTMSTTALDEKATHVSSFVSHLEDEHHPLI